MNLAAGWKSSGVFLLIGYDRARSREQRVCGSYRIPRLFLKWTGELFILPLHHSNFTNVGKRRSRNLVSRTMAFKTAMSFVVRRYSIEREVFSPDPLSKSPK